MIFSKEEIYYLGELSLTNDLKTRLKILEVTKEGFDLEELKKYTLMRQNLKNSNLLLQKDFQFHQPQNSKTETIIRNFEYYNLNLKKEINKRKLEKKFFLPIELLKIIYDSLNALSFLQENNIENGFLNPNLIYLYHDQNNFLRSKIIERLNRKKNYYENIENDLEKSIDIYFSPEIFEDFLNKKQNNFLEKSLYNLNIYKADLFSLGLIILEASLLEPIQIIYNFVQKKFISENLFYLLEKLKKLYKNSELFCSLVEALLEIDPEIRYDLKSFQESLPEFNDLKNDANFTPVVLNSILESNVKNNFKIINYQDDYEDKNFNNNLLENIEKNNLEKDLDKIINKKKNFFDYDKDLDEIEKFDYREEIMKSGDKFKLNSKNNFKNNLELSNSKKINSYKKKNLENNNMNNTYNIQESFPNYNYNENQQNKVYKIFDDNNNNSNEINRNLNYSNNQINRNLNYSNNEKILNDSRNQLLSDNLKYSNHNFSNFQKNQNLRNSNNLGGYNILNNHELLQNSIPRSQIRNSKNDIMINQNQSNFLQKVQDPFSNIYNKKNLNQNNFQNENLNFDKESENFQNNLKQNFQNNLIQNNLEENLQNNLDQNLQNNLNNNVQNNLNNNVQNNYDNNLQNSLNNNVQNIKNFQSRISNPNYQNKNVSKKDPILDYYSKQFKIIPRIELPEDFQKKHLAVKNFHEQKKNVSHQKKDLFISEHNNNKNENLKKNINYSQPGNNYNSQRIDFYQNQNFQKKKKLLEENYNPKNLEENYSPKKIEKIYSPKKIEENYSPRKIEENYSQRKIEENYNPKKIEGYYSEKKIQENYSQKKRQNNYQKKFNQENISIFTKKKKGINQSKMYLISKIMKN